jgi:GNAT superfamily N-acetyltransferase
MGYLVTLDPARQDIDAIHRILAATYWSPNIRRDIVAKAFANSIAAVAIDEASGATVGVARVVSDRATFAWLCDVFVAEAHRGQGLASRMIEALEAHPELATLRRWCLATRDAHRLYEGRGYGPVRPGAWMERKGPESAWQADAAVTPSAR